MTLHTKQIIKAALITPWAVVPIAALYSLAYRASWMGKELPDPSVGLIWPHPFHPWETVFLYSLYGIPTAYLGLLLVGLPCSFIARKTNTFSYTTAVFAAMAACVPAALFYGNSSSFLPLYFFLLFFGIPLALTYVCIVKPKAGPDDLLHPLRSTKKETTADNADFRR